MNILFDFISIQSYISGGGEYVKVVFAELLKRDINIYGLYDSKLSFLKNDFSDCKKKCVELLDIQMNKICHFIQQNKIDIFFIGIAQRYFKYDLNNITCKTIVTIHDIGDIETYSNNLHFHYKKSLKNFIKNSIDYCPFLRKVSTDTRTRNLYKNLTGFLQKDNVHIITVSNYSLNSIRYYFPNLINKCIRVLYPPERISLDVNSSQNNAVRELLINKVKYILLVNANRDNKNALLVYKVFLNLRKSHPSLHLVIIGDAHSHSNFKSDMENIISFDFVSIIDLNYLYKSAFALVYPSLTEGFGYPPLEAMKYGTPVISSNVCSMPEVLEDSAIYFSPFYENDLFSKIVYLHNNEEEFRLKAQEQYLKVKRRQSEDLNKLIDIIIL